MYTIGVVPYLNALPLFRTLETSGAARIVRSVPRRLAQQLADGECDVALIPVVEHFRGVGEKIISDAGIASSGDVRSVLLFSKVAPGEIESVALDLSSRTSVALTTILLRDAYKVQPIFVEHAPDMDAMLQTCDAALLIGDPALEARRQLFGNPANTIQIIDLGAAWTKLTSLPFVYAAWVTRRGLDLASERELLPLLNTARDEGKANLGEILSHNPNPTNLSIEEIRLYLTEAIEHTLTPQHFAGLEEFRRRCRAHGLV